MAVDNGAAAFREAVSFLCTSLRDRLLRLPDRAMQTVQEIRLLRGEPPALREGNHLCRLDRFDAVSQAELSACLLSLSGQALHTHQPEIARGFLTLPGGHRAGIAATVVADPSGQTVNLRDVNAIILRIARSFPSAADDLIAKAFSNGIESVLLAGPPSSGKTTILRALANRLAKGAVVGGDRVAVVDERSELAAFCQGCCVLRGYSKREGMLTAIRGLAPQVILCDELGAVEEAQAVVQALHAGVAVILTIHAESLDGILRKQAARLLVKTGAFAFAVILSDQPHPGIIKEVVRLDEVLQAHRPAAVNPLLHPGRSAARPAIFSSFGSA